MTDSTIYSPSLADLQAEITRLAEEAQMALRTNSGEIYDLEDLKKAYSAWLGDSINALLSECYPLVAGTNKHAFNPYPFANSLRQMTSSPVAA